jgi:hypothetical protein
MLAPMGRFVLEENRGNPQLIIGLFPVAKKNTIDSDLHNKMYPCRRSVNL